MPIGLKPRFPKFFTKILWRTAKKTKQETRKKTHLKAVTSKKPYPQGDTGGGLEEAQVNSTSAGEGNERKRTGRRERLKREMQSRCGGESKLVEKTGGKAEHEKNGKRRRKTRKQIYKKDTYRERKMTGP